MSRLANSGYAQGFVSRMDAAANFYDWHGAGARRPLEERRRLIDACWETLTIRASGGFDD